MHTLGEPTWFGRYRLTSRIATGGMAEVYLGRHITEEGAFGPLVAVKRLLPHLVKDQQVVRMFLNEARITAQITHPNVVRIVDLGQEKGEPYIAMELLEGRTMADIRLREAEEGRRVPNGVMLRILTDACRGLDAAHRAVDDDGHALKLVHRDFTPDNIHVGISGDIKVIDFGVAKTSAWGAGTEPGTLKGKFFYMSPEMILARPVDHRADIFAAGVMLYEQLCGRRPFTGTSVDEVVMRIAEGRAKPPHDFDPAVPMLLEAVCLRALAHDPAARFQTLQELIDAIETVGGDAEVKSREAVGQYVRELFPEDKDPKRQTLKRAREADPSHPAMAPLDPKKAAQPVPYLESEPSTRADRPSSLSNPGVPGPASAAAAGAQPTSGPFPRAFKLPDRKVMLAAGAALAALVLLIAAVLALRSPAQTPDEALKQAEALSEPAGRARLLAPLAKNPRATEAQLARAAQLLMASKAYDAALEVADAWQAKAPKSVAALMLEGRAATQARKGKRAEAAIEKAAALAPDDASPDVALAELRELQGDSAAALEAWSKATKKSPTGDNLARQGYWLSQTGRLEEAEKVLERALRKEFHPAVAAELGFVKFRQGQLDEARGLLNKTVKRSPQLMTAHYYLGAVFYRQGNAQQARAEYLEADRLAPTDSRPLVALCEMEAQLSKPELEETKKAIAQRFSAALAQKCASTSP